MKVRTEELLRKKELIFDVDDSESVKNIGFNLEKPLKINYKLRVLEDYGKEEAEIKIKISGDITVSCDRCLSPFQYGVEFENAVRCEIDDLGKEIDLESEAQQALSLDLPMKFLCRKDCKGLCIKCGRNKNLEKCSCII